MDTKIDNFWTSFGTILEPILAPKIHQKMKQKGDPFWNPFWRPKRAQHRSPAAARGGPIATGSELIKAKKYRKPIGLLSTGILSTTEYSTSEGPIQAIVKTR